MLLNQGPWPWFWNIFRAASDLSFLHLGYIALISFTSLAESGEKSLITTSWLLPILDSELSLIPFIFCAFPSYFILLHSYILTLSHISMFLLLLHTSHNFSRRILLSWFSLFSFPKIYNSEQIQQIPSHYKFPIVSQCFHYFACGSYSISHQSICLRLCSKRDVVFLGIWYRLLLPERHMPQ